MAVIDRDALAPQIIEPGDTCWMFCKGWSGASEGSGSPVKTGTIVRHPTTPGDATGTITLSTTTASDGWKYYSFVAPSDPTGTRTAIFQLTVSGVTGSITITIPQDQS